MFIWRNNRTLGRYVRKTENKPLCRRTVGFFKETPQFVKCVGDMHLVENLCNLEFITHEAEHSVQTWSAKLKLQPALGTEHGEKTAYAVGKLVNDICHQLSVLGYDDMFTIEQPQNRPKKFLVNAVMR